MRFTSHSLFAVLVLSIAAFGQSINLDTQVKGSRLPMWGVDSGSANAYAIATIGALGPSLRTGSRFAFIATHANTTASTLAVDGGSTIAIKKNVSAALVSGDIALNQVIEVTYDGTNFQIVGPGALTFSAIGGTLGCSQLPTFTGGVTNSACVMTALPVRGISFTIGDPAATSALTAASTTTDYVTVPFGCTISAYNLLVDAGTITVKFWKIATGTAIPTSSNSINTSGVAISSGTAIHSTTLSDFTTTTITANDIMAMNVTAVATAKYVNGVLQCQ